MKKFNLTVIACIIATFVFSMFAFQPTSTEASKSVEPSANPTPRRIRNIPAPTPSPITKVRTKKPAYKEGGVNDTTYRKFERGETGNFRQSK